MNPFRGNGGRTVRADLSKAKSARVEVDLGNAQAPRPAARDVITRIAAALPEIAPGIEPAMAVGVALHVMRAVSDLAVGRESRSDDRAMGRESRSGGRYAIAKTTDAFSGQSDSAFRVSRPSAAQWAAFRSSDERGGGGGGGGDGGDGRDNTEGSHGLRIAEDPVPEDDVPEDDVPEDTGELVVYWSVDGGDGPTLTTDEFVEELWAMAREMARYQAEQREQAQAAAREQAQAAAKERAEQREQARARERERAEQARESAKGYREEAETYRERAADARADGDETAAKILEDAARRAELRAAAEDARAEGDDESVAAYEAELERLEEEEAARQEAKAQAEREAKAEKKMPVPDEGGDPSSVPFHLALPTLPSPASRRQPLINPDRNGGSQTTRTSPRFGPVNATPDPSPEDGARVVSRLHKPRVSKTPGLVNPSRASSVGKTSIPVAEGRSDGVSWRLVVEVFRPN